MNYLSTVKLIILPVAVGLSLLRPVWLSSDIFKSLKN